MRLLCDIHDTSTDIRDTPTRVNLRIMSHYEGGTEGKGDVDDGASNHSPTSSSKKLKSVSTSAPSLIHTDKDDNKTCSNSTNNQTDLPLRHAIPLDMVVLGAVNAGKTALVKRILHGTFWEEPPVSICLCTSLVWLLLSFIVMMLHNAYAIVMIIVITYLLVLLISLFWWRYHFCLIIILLPLLRFIIQ